MVKFASYLFVAALVAAPVFASVNWDNLETRDLSDQELFGRELTEAEASVYAREIEELFSRLPEDVATREMQELVDRSKIGRKIGNFFKKAWRGIKKVGAHIIHAILRREDGEEVLEREYDEIDARDLDELYERYIEEIEERTPHLFSFMADGMKHIKAIAHQGEHTPSSEPQQPVSREYLDEDLVERDFDDEEFIERDYLPEVYERSYSDYEEDLLAREFEEFDDLD